MVRLISIIILFFNANLTLSQDENLYVTDKQIITSEDIKNSGITRLSDIFSLINNVNYSTINGYEYSLSINGLESFQRELWIIMLNGQRIDFRIFEDGNINNTSVTLNNIDFIEVYTIPQIIEGEFTDAGLIHIHTLFPNEGITLKGKLQIGSETGDPGPYRYTGDTSPNIDNQGTNYSTSLNLKDDDVYSIISFKKNMETLTSPAYVKRIYSISPPLDDWPFLGLYAPSLHIGLKTGIFKSEFYGTYSEIKDYFFFKAYGREIPIKNKFLHIGVTGHLYAFKKNKLSYKLKYSNNKLKKVENVLDADPDWKFENIYGNLQSDFSLNNLNLHIGAGINIYKPTSTSLEKHNYFSLTKFYGLTSFMYNNAITQNIGLFLTGNVDEAAIKAYIANEFKINENNKISSFVSYSKSLFDENQNIWFWTYNGLQIFKNKNFPNTIFHHGFESGKKFTFDIVYNSKVSKDIDIKLYGLIRSFIGTYIEQHNYLYDTTDGSFFPSSIIYSDQNGNVIGGGFSLKHKISSKVKQTLSYNLIKSINSDTLFNNVWQSIPNHRISYNIEYTPFENFILYGYFNYTSSTTWTDFRDINESSGGLYTSKLKDNLSVDITFLKYFWEKRLSANLILRNIFNRKNQTHPIGRISKFAYHLKLTMDISLLNGLF